MQCLLFVLRAMNNKLTHALIKKTENQLLFRSCNDLEWTLWKIYYYFIGPPLRVRLNEVQFNLDLIRIVRTGQSTNLKLNGNLFLCLKN